MDPAGCDGILPAQGVPFDDSTELCAIDSPTFTAGTCHGDSGGPIVVVGPGSQLVQVGITSRGDPGCSTLVPGVFTTVPPLSSWITSVIAPTSASGPPAPTSVSVPPPTLTSGLPKPKPMPISIVLPIAPAGHFRELTSERDPISLRASGGALTALRLTFAMRCTDGTRTPNASATIVAPSSPVKLTRRNGHWDFSVRAAAGGGVHLAVQGNF